MTIAAERVEHRYVPRGVARELFACRAPEVLLSGPAGTGKSRACLEKLHMMALLNPGMRGLICRKTAVSLASTALVTFREHVAKEALASGEVVFYGGSAQEAASYQYGNGSVIVVGGLDKPSRIMSSEYDVVYVQEATELDEGDWEAITTRLRNGVVSFQQLLADCNPGAPHHWLKTRCDAGRAVEMFSRHEDNPRLFDGSDWTDQGTQYIGLLDRLTGVRKERLRYGKWAAADGLIYDNYDPSIHLYKHMDRPPLDWPRYLAVDFGFTNPFVCQWWAMDHDGRLYLYREIYMTQRLVEDHAKAILAVRDSSGHKDPDPHLIVCDHDAEGRATLERALGRSTVAAHKSVLEGIEAVKARMKVLPDGKPRLYVCRDAVLERDNALEAVKKPICTEQELAEYAWNDKAKKEEPIKLNDHGSDAMRYLVAQIDLVGRPRVRWL